MIATLSNLGQCFDGSRLYYGVQMGKKNLYISSDKETLKYEDLSERGLRFPNLPEIEISPCAFFESNSWSSAGIKEFSDSTQKLLAPKEVFLNAKKLLEQFYSPLKEHDIPYLALSILQTGCYTAFQTTPHLRLTGNPHLIQTLFDVLANICFQGIRLNLPSLSLVSRIISRHGSTILVHTPYDIHHRFMSNLSTLLADGSRCTGTFPFLNEYSYPSILPIYSPKILSMDIRDRYLESLGVEIQVQKAPPISPFLNLREWAPEFQKLRDSIHIFCLENIFPIYEAYKNLSSILLPNHGIPPQDIEKRSGIFALASYLDTFFEAPFLFDSMVAMAKDEVLKRAYDQKFDDKERHITFLVAEFIQRFKPNSEGYYRAEHISRYINKAGDLTQDLRTEDITRPLKRFIIHRKRSWIEAKGEAKRQRTFIKINEEKLLDFINSGE